MAIIFFSRIKFIFRKPPLSFVSNIFRLPFHRSLWIAVGIFLIAIFIMLAVSMIWEWKKLNVPHHPSQSFSDSILIIIGVISQQGMVVSKLTSKIFTSSQGHIFELGLV